MQVFSEIINQVEKVIRQKYGKNRGQRKQQNCTIIEQCIGQTEILSFIVQIVSAFLELDSSSLMHLDLKPENILIKSESSELKHFVICDFGCSQKSQGIKFLKYDNPVFGTFKYLSPENYLQNQYEKHRSSADVWSFGVILYQIIFQKLPFATIKRQDMSYKKLKKFYQKQLKINICANRKICKQIIDLVYLMLNPIPSQRPTWKQIKKDLINKMHIKNYEFFDINCILFCLNTLFKLLVAFLQKLSVQIKNKKTPFWEKNISCVSKMMFSIIEYAKKIGYGNLKKQAYRWKLGFDGLKNVFMTLFQKVFILKKKHLNLFVDNPQEQQSILQTLQPFRIKFGSQIKNTKSLIFIDTFSFELMAALKQSSDLLSNIYLFSESFKLI